MDIFLFVSGEFGLPLCASDNLRFHSAILIGSFSGVIEQPPKDHS
jgi:hypothetical protein